MDNKETDKRDEDSFKELLSKIQNDTEIYKVPSDKDFVLHGPRNYKPNFTTEEQLYLKEFFDQHTGGPINTMSLICRKHQCTVKEFCPIYKLDPDKVPEGELCPVEQTIIYRMIEDYKNELEIEDEDIVDLAILKEYVMWQIYNKRAQEQLAKNPEIVKKEFIGYTENGTPIYREFLNPTFNLLEKSSKTKKKLLESLIATREAKSKDTTRKHQTFAEFARIFQERLQRLKNERQEEIVEVDHKLLEEDLDQEE